MENVYITKVILEEVRNLTYAEIPLSTKEKKNLIITGKNGSGKTTVIRAVLGALGGGGRVSTGDIQFHGHSLLSNTKNEWRNLRGTRISMIFQDPDPYP